MINENMAVAHLSERLALICGYNYSFAQQIKWAALHHDVGKKELPQDLLNKPCGLLPCEFEIVKQHTKIGARILSQFASERGKVASLVALLHHEWHNGQGYWGYKGREIPMYANIVSVCDVYVALCSKRAYKQAWSADVALEYIKDRTGSQFCPTIVQNFIKMIGYNVDSARFVR